LKASSSCNFKKSYPTSTDSALFVVEQVGFDSSNLSPTNWPRRSPAVPSVHAIRARTSYLDPGSPWETGHCEGVNARLRDGLLSGKVVYTPKENQIVIKQWRRHHHTARPHSAFCNWLLAPDATIPMDQRSSMH